MKKISLVILLISTIISSSIYAQAHDHGMQHGFVISSDETYFNHLVATGHHSHQLSLTGELEIQDSVEKEFFLERKKQNSNRKAYFLFQAQNLNLPMTQEGQILTGHIIESTVGDYSPQNIIVKDAKIKVNKVLINVVNPFFIDQ